MAAFKFAAPKTELQEVAIINISGSLVAPREGRAEMRAADFAAAVDASREELVREVYLTLGMPGDTWGSVVSTRPIVFLAAGERDEGTAKPWMATIGTITTDACMRHKFGEFLTDTHAIQVNVKVCTDVKKDTWEKIWFEVEVGAVHDGRYAHFQSVGGKGRVVATPGADTGVVLTMIMDQNPRHFDYFDEDWRMAEEHYATDHVQKALRAGLDAASALTVTVEPIATRALVPVNSLVKKQSCRGLETHMLVKGVCFFRATTADDGTSVQAPPISLSATLLTGGLAPDRVTPLTGPVTVRFKLPGVSGGTERDGHWYAPRAMQVDEAARDARRTAGSSTEAGPAWFTNRSVRRAQQRRSSAAHARAAAVDAARASDGGVSDGDGTRSLVAGVSNMQAVPPVAAGDAAGSAPPPSDAAPAVDTPMADPPASGLD